MYLQIPLPNGFYSLHTACVRVIPNAVDRQMRNNWHSDCLSGESEQWWIVRLLRGRSNGATMDFGAGRYS